MTSTWLTASQVAQRLGVKPATVYAYVSRGMLHRQIGDDGRTSRFDPAEVDDLARRGRPRRDARRTGIVDVVLSTSLTEIRDGELRYRGHDAVELVATSSFEDVAELLWTGTLTERARWTAPAHDLALARAVSQALGAAVTPADRIRVATAAVASSRPLRVDLRPDSVTEHARTLLATLVESLPPSGTTRSSADRLECGPVPVPVDARSRAIHGGQPAARRPRPWTPGRTAVAEAVAPGRQAGPRPRPRRRPRPPGRPRAGQLDPRGADRGLDPVRSLRRRACRARRGQRAAARRCRFRRPPPAGAGAHDGLPRTGGRRGAQRQQAAAGVRPPPLPGRRSPGAVPARPAPRPARFSRHRGGRPDSWPRRP